MDVADLPGDQALLHRQEAPAEALRVAHDRIDAGRLDRAQDLLRLAGVGGERLLDEERMAALHGGERRPRMIVLVGRDDRRGHFAAGRAARRSAS